MRWDPLGAGDRDAATLAAAAVAVISKLPRMGRSKTRLARSLGDEAALRLHRAFLDDELNQLEAPDRWQLYLVHDAPEDDDEGARLEGLLGERAASLVPDQAGLAAELHRAFELLLAEHAKAIIVSGDVPHLSADVVGRALHALENADVVLGTGPDGGYYLVGMSAPHDIFTPVQMSTGRTVEATVALATSLGLRVARIDRLADIDEAQDLLALDQADSKLARATRAVVNDLARGELALAPPTELQIEVTSRCNLLCSACERTHADLGPDVDLSLADYREIVADLPNLQRVAFHLNGESLLNEDLPAMVTDAAAAGAWTLLNSNGTLLDPRRRAALLDSGLHELRVSLDGTRPKTVSRMAGAPILDRVVGNVRAFVRERGEQTHPRVSLWMILTRETVEDLPDLVRLAADMGVEEVYGQRLVVTGHGVARKELSLHGRIDGRARELVGRAEAVAAELGVSLRGSGRRPILDSLTPATETNPWLACWRPWRSAVVTASRRVLPCCISSFVLGYDDLELGDLTEEDWHTIYNGPRYRALRRGLLSGQPLPSCQGCTRDWSL